MNKCFDLFLGFFFFKYQWLYYDRYSDYTFKVYYLSNRIPNSKYKNLNSL